MRVHCHARHDNAVHYMTAWESHKERHLSPMNALPQWGMLQPAASGHSLYTGTVTDARPTPSPTSARPAPTHRRGRGQADRQMLNGCCVGASRDALHHLLQNQGSGAATSSSWQASTSRTATCDERPMLLRGSHGG